MGNGITNTCCRRKGEYEPEISAGKISQNRSRRNTKDRNSNNNNLKSQVIQKESIIIDNKTHLRNQIKKIGNILTNDILDYIPKNIKQYISRNPYEKGNHKISRAYSNNFSENIFLSESVQFKNNNIIYCGEWTKEGIINGKGRMYKPKNEIFIEGEWANGSLVYGRLIGDKKIYIGSIEDNQFHGKGKLINFEHSSYEGFFSNGKKSGHGKLTYTDGCSYEGNFNNDEIDGYGEFIWNDGNYYKGDFTKGIFHGNGLLKWKNGDVYMGEFKKGFFCGNGIFYWKNEDEYYKGEYINNNKSGNGLYKLKNGDVYIGQWKDNTPYGRGSYETKNKIYSGMWKDGIFSKILDIVSKYQSGEINENVNFNFIPKVENINISTLEHINLKMMEAIN